MDNILNTISQREKSIEIKKHKISLCYNEIKENPKSALSVFVIDMEARLKIYEKSLIRLKCQLGTLFFGRKKYFSNFF